MKTNGVCVCFFMSVREWSNIEQQPGWVSREQKKKNGYVICVVLCKGSIVQQGRGITPN